MEVLYFLKNRTRLIRQYYECAAQPFIEIKRKIEEEEEPYVPPYFCPDTDNLEPAFLSEWIDACDLLEITGRCCVSMLSASLQLYFKTWEHELRLSCGKDFSADFKKEGLVGGYRACLTECAGIDWSCCPVDFAIIEQVVLARNRDQHPESIGTVRVSHAKKDLHRHPRPFFLSESESQLFQESDSPSMFMPQLHVSHDKLITAIDQVERLCEWLEERMFKVKYPR